MRWPTIIGRRAPQPKEHKKSPTIQAIAEAPPIDSPETPESITGESGPASFAAKVKPSGKRNGSRGRANERRIDNLSEPHADDRWGFTHGKNRMTQAHLNSLPYREDIPESENSTSRGMYL